MLKEALARLTLKSISHPLFSRLSWNRVRIVLMNTNRYKLNFVGNFLIVDLLYHMHAVYLHLNGRGYLLNPQDESAPKYKLVAPKDVQAMVRELHSLHKANMRLN